MRFTWYAVVLPLFLNLILYFLYPAVGNEWPGGPLWKVTALWCAFGFPFAFVYWMVRLVRSAWQDGSATQTAHLVIEAGEPDNGRIFGRLN
jgi:protein-S-isoprenylcysteine O-methyltransferase Ste14